LLGDVDVNRAATGQWELMAKMEQWAGQSVDLSYRGVGSSTGKKEYLAGKSSFGCAELAVSAAEKAAVPSRTVLHLPLVMGAMSAFHSIPKTYVGTSGLELSPCLLAKIFSRKITMWNDAALREGETINLGLKNVNQPIVVFHRHKGSSTTNFFTKYLHESTRKACPTAWTIGWGGALTTAADVAKYSTVTGTWDPSGTCDATGAKCVQGSGGMSKGLKDTPYAIGYIDSGHGLSDGHSEVKLKNLAGKYLDSAMAGQNGVMAAVTAATAAGNMPTSASAGGWENVNLINQAGANTWP
jgi:phosphate transport system substrate-binding protein